MTDKESDKLRSEVAFKNVVVPFLKSHGWIDTQIEFMLPRTRFGKDYKNWSIRLEDNKSDDVPEIELLLRHTPDSSRLILQTFVHEEKVMSYGVISAAMLSRAIRDKTLCTDHIHRLEGVYFRCFSFSIAKKMFGDLCYVFNA